jgi:hypothetical protein
LAGARRTDGLNRAAWAEAQICQFIPPLKDASTSLPTISPADGDLVDLIPLYTSDPAKQNWLLVTNPERLFKFDTTG